MRASALGLRLLVTAAFALAWCAQADGDVLGTYSFAGTDPAGDADTPNVNGTAAPNLTFTTFTRVGLSSVSAGNGFRSSGYSTAAAINLNQYVQFSAIADAGYALELWSLAYSSLRTDSSSPLGRGPQQGALRSDFEGFAAGSGTGSTYSNTSATPAIVNQTWDFTDFTSASGGSGTFRMYGWQATVIATNAGIYLDNFTLNGHVVALAQMQASAPASQAVIVGATGGVDISIANTATGGTRQQGLSYNASGTGDLSGSGSNSNLAPGPADTVTLNLDTSSAGSRSGNVNVTSNAYATNGQAGTSTFNQAVSVDVLDHSNASFSGTGDVNEITIDFGTVVQGTLASIGGSIFNLIATTGFTAALDLDDILETDPDDVFSTDLAAFTNLASGDSNGFLLNLDTSQPGSFSGTYALSLSDENLPGAAGGQALTINLLGNVTAVPEPAGAILLLFPAALLLRGRRAHVRPRARTTVWQTAG